MRKISRGSWVSGLRGYGQSLISKWFRDVKSEAPVFCRGFLISVLSIADWVKLLRHAYVVCFVSVKWFGDLTRFFWWFAARTSNGKSKNKGNRWVVAPFGLHS